MDHYFYVFGYENVEEWRSNKDAGTDFESSCFFLIRAESKEQALKWGVELSKWYVKRLFAGTGDVQWREDNFAFWIEEDPDDEDRKLGEAIGPIDVGTYPDFEAVTKLHDIINNRPWRDKEVKRILRHFNGIVVDVKFDYFGFVVGENYSGRCYYNWHIPTYIRRGVRILD